MQADHPGGETSLKSGPVDGGKKVAPVVAHLESPHRLAPAEHLLIDSSDAERPDDVGLQDQARAQGLETRRPLQNQAFPTPPLKERSQGQSPDAAAGNEQGGAHTTTRPSPPPARRCRP